MDGLRWLATLIVLPLVGSAGCASSRPAAPSSLVAVLRVNTFGLPDDQAPRLRQTIASAVAESSASLVASGEGVDRAMAQTSACAHSDPEQTDRCALAAGRRLGATHVVAGSVGKLEKTHLVQLRLLRVDRAAAVRTLEETSFGDLDALQGVVRSMATRLFDQPTLQSKPWYRRWWVWTLVGATAAAGVIVPVVATRHDDFAGRQLDLP